MSAPLTDRVYFKDIVTGEEMVTMRAKRYDETRDALARLEARVDALTAALEVYADARHWGIQRDQHRYPICAWIGSGATDATPNGPGVARAALAGAAPEATP